MIHKKKDTLLHMFFTKEAQNQLKLCQGETQLAHDTWPALSSLLWLRAVHASQSEASPCVERSLRLCNVDFIGADVDVIDADVHVDVDVDIDVDVDMLMLIFMLMSMLMLMWMLIK